MTEKPKLSRLDNKAHIEKAYQDIKDMDFKHIRNTNFDKDKLVTTKSCDKIITTFETVITWFDPSDVLPKNDSEILFRTQNGLLHIGIFTGDIIDYEDCLFRTHDWSYKIHKVMWWAEIPRFE